MTTTSLAILDQPKFQFNSRARITGAAFGVIPPGQKDHYLNRPRRVRSSDHSMAGRMSRLQQIVEGTFAPEYVPRYICPIGKKA